MATLYDLRLEAHLSVNEFSSSTRVDRNTIAKAEKGLPIRDVKAATLVDFLSKRLQRPLTIRDVDGLNILTPKEVNKVKEAIAVDKSAHNVHN